MRENKLKTLWNDSKPALNAWLTIPSSWSAELMAHAGYDALTIDMQHGLMDFQIALSMLQAISTTEVVPLVRVPWNEPAMIMRMLDAGAYGIICPMVNTRTESERFVQACRYPPAGNRSYGPIRAATYAGDDYFTAANHTILALAMIETNQALDNVHDISATPGLDGLYVGAVDLSISMGLSEKIDLDNPQLQEALHKIVLAADNNNIIAGIHVNKPENATILSKIGFRLLTPANDSVLLKTAANSTLVETLNGLEV